MDPIPLSQALGARVSQVTKRRHLTLQQDDQVQEDNILILDVGIGQGGTRSLPLMPKLVPVTLP